ncbi:hypothetical protein BN2127_JRS7_01985 [Bacillus subtilis]|jgi:hypothetical protein|nr:hypothetical protein BN2127_JRS7_01985 [Bacillus subtilis]
MMKKVLPQRKGPFLVLSKYVILFSLENRLIDILG